MVANAAKSYGHKNVFYEPDKEKLPDLLLQLEKKGDIIVTLGAGDIWKYGEEFINLYTEKGKQ